MSQLMKINLVAILGGLMLLFLVNLQALANPAVHEATLKNGLNVIIKVDHRAPIVVSQIWYKVGSAYEYSGITGISHVLEHMMFKGTDKVPAGEFSRRISVNGGSENAFTGRDYTAYFQTLANDRLEISLKLEADRMRGLTLPVTEFDKERQVVIEERRLRTEDDPQALLYEQFNALAFINSPYHHPIIGWMDDLNHLNINDLKAWYKHWYVPNNATLVIVGDVEPQAVMKEVKRYFGRIKATPIATAKPRREMEQRGLRRSVLQVPAEVPYLIMGYKVPSLVTAAHAQEAYALEVLAGILDGGNSARLSRELVRGSNIAASTNAGYNLISKIDDLLILDGTPATGTTVATLEQALRQQIQRLRNEPVSQSELDRVKAQVVAANVYERDSVFYQAMKIGMFETVGLDWQLVDQYVDHIKAVTAEDIQAVAVKYLQDKNLTIATLDPQPLPNQATATRHSAGGHHGH